MESNKLQMSRYLFGGKFCYVAVYRFVRELSTLPKHAQKVYLQLIEHAVMNNYGLMSNEQLATLTGLSKSRISKARKILRERFLVTYPARGIYELSRDIVWFGTLAQCCNEDKNDSNKDEWFEELRIVKGDTLLVSHRYFHWERNPKLLRKMLTEQQKKFARKRRDELDELWIFS